MPDIYKPTSKSYFKTYTVEKLIKDLIKNHKENRKLALDTHKILVEEFERGLLPQRIPQASDTERIPEPQSVKAEMIEALKLAQEADESILKLVDLATKIAIIDKKDTPASTGKRTSFSELSQQNLHEEKSANKPQ